MIRITPIYEGTNSPVPDKKQKMSPPTVEEIFKKTVSDPQQSIGDSFVKACLKNDIAFVQRVLQNNQSSQVTDEQWAYISNNLRKLPIFKEIILFAYNTQDRKILLIFLNYKPTVFYEETCKSILKEETVLRIILPYLKQKSLNESPLLSFLSAAYNGNLHQMCASTPVEVPIDYYNAAKFFIPQLREALSNQDVSHWEEQALANYYSYLCIETLHNPQALISILKKIPEPSSNNPTLGVLYYSWKGLPKEASSYISESILIDCYDAAMDMLDMHHPWETRGIFLQRLEEFSEKWINKKHAEMVCDRFSPIFF